MIGHGGFHGGGDVACAVGGKLLLEESKCADSVMVMDGTYGKMFLVLVMDGRSRISRFLLFCIWSRKYNTVHHTT